MVVVDRGSFNQAAAELYMAQSVVSEHIHDLEASLGATLFTRSSRGVTPTPAGEVLYDYAGRMLALLAEAERAIIQIDAQDRQLVVSATPGVSVYLLPAWLQRFGNLHPNIGVSLHTALTTEVIKGVLSRRDDLGFLEGELDELDDASLGRMRLRDINYRVIVNAAHPLASAEAVTLDQLAAQPFIHRLPSSRSRRWLESVLMRHGIRLRTAAELDSPGAIKYALLNQSAPRDGLLNLSILPDYTVEREIERGELRSLPLADVYLRRPLLLVWDKRAPLSAIQRAFVALLAEESPQVSILL